MGTYRAAAGAEGRLLAAGRRLWVPSVLLLASAGTAWLSAMIDAAAPGAPAKIAIAMCMQVSPTTQRHLCAAYNSQQQQPQPPAPSLLLGSHAVEPLLEPGTHLG
jgi:hypothetical protein